MTVEKSRIVAGISRPAPREPQTTPEYYKKHFSVTDARIKEAAKMRVLQKISIDKALFLLGYIDKKEMFEAISNIYNIGLVNIDDISFEKKLLDEIPAQIVKRHTILPLKKEDKNLKIAVTYPLSDAILKNLKRSFKCEIEQKLGDEAEIKNKIALLYATTNTLSDKNASAIDIVNEIIMRAVRMKASDIHIEPFEDRIRLRYRIDGVLEEIALFDTDQQSAIVSRIKVIGGLNITEKREPQDGAVKFSKEEVEIDLRVSVLPSLYGEKIVMRLLAGESTRLIMSRIGLSDRDYKVFNKLISRPYGIILIVGPTGSGKSTTLSAALETINKPGINIITVEDPVEYKIDGITQVPVGKTNAKINFAKALRSILRQDPDVIMVGETRDSETAEISLRASLTGHMVFTTLHTNDAPSSLSRLIDMGCEPFLVAASVSGVLAQRLLRKLCPKCKEPYTPAEKEILTLGIKREDCSETWFRKKGCSFCNNLGYKGRIGAFELLEVDSRIEKEVINGAELEKVKALALENGMKTLRDDAIDKLNNGITSVEEVLRTTIEES